MKEKALPTRITAKTKMNDRLLDEIIRRYNAHVQLVAALREAGSAATIAEYYDGNVYTGCPVCECNVADGHNAACVVSQALRAAEV